MSKTRILLWFFLSTAAALLIYNSLFEKVHPLGGLNLKIDESEIRQRSAILLDDFKIKTDSLKPDITLISNKDLMQQLQVEKGLDQANRLMRSDIAVFYWDIVWSKKDRSNITISGSGSRRNRDSRGEDQISLSYSVRGDLLEFTRYDLDSVNLKKITFDEARGIADSFLVKYTSLENISTDSLKFSDTAINHYTLKTEEKSESGDRTENKFIWTGKSRYLNNDMKVTLVLSGELVSNFKIEEIVPSDKYSSDIQPIFHAIAQILFYIVIFILIAIVAFRRIRAFEIGFRTAVIMGLLTAVLFGIELYFMIGDQLGWEILLPLLLGPVLYGAAIILLWAVSETITRETWEEKFISTDLLTKGYSLHSKIGTAFLTGSSAGFLIAAIWLLLFYAASLLFPVSYIIEDNQFLGNVNSAAPVFTLFIHNIYAAIFIAAVFFLFLCSGLKRRFSTFLPLLLITSILWGSVNMEKINPVYLAIIIEMAAGALLVYLFYKTDVLTVIIALAAFNMMSGAFTFFKSGNVNYSEPGYLLLSLFVLLTIYSIITLFTQDKVTDFKNITPAFVKNITERQRLQRELEIARDVQMSFLPQRTPEFSGLQVASRCLPALEVGGDYYDFVKLSDKKLGIIIGDVSGKGTQAAFYMTLTKGFLKALSKMSESSSEMLMKMNELFYENVERGTFISMIYGIFDIEEKTLTLARAGHNPVIARKTAAGTIQKIDPKGLALGLEKGNIFNKTLKEMNVPFEQGDVFVFYTDGFTEAMNKTKDEYGEERLSEAVVKYSDRSAEEIMDVIFNDVKAFIGKAKQHDDMTMVVVKVK